MTDIIIERPRACVRAVEESRRGLGAIVLGAKLLRCGVASGIADPELRACGQQVLGHYVRAREMQQMFQPLECHALSWLLFIPQLPASPSSARVTMWRRLKAAGAASLLTGAWLLPRTEQHGELLSEISQFVRAQGGAAALFAGQALRGFGDGDIVELFRADRAREYDEFSTRATAFLDEVDKETRAGKFTFAELEELEDDLEKLSKWLNKITARDFFPDGRNGEEVKGLAQCRIAHEAFAARVYAVLGGTDQIILRGSPSE